MSRLPRPKFHHFLILDEDPWASHIKVFLEHYYEDCEMKVVSTESQFRTYMGNIVIGVQRPPQIVISEISLPLIAESEKHRTFEEFQGMPDSAGQRCLRAFRQSGATAHIPWIYFTAVNDWLVTFQDDINGCTFCLQKENRLWPLRDLIPKIFKGEPIPPEWARTIRAGA